MTGDPRAIAEGLSGVVASNSQGRLVRMVGVRTVYVWVESPKGGDGEAGSVACDDSAGRQASPNNSGAPSGSDLGEGVVERATARWSTSAAELLATALARETGLRRATFLSELLTGDPGYRDVAALKAIDAALSTPSSTLTPDADLSDHTRGYRDAWTDIAAATPAIRDQAFEEAVRDALGGYSLAEGTLEQSLDGFIANLNFYSTLVASLGENTREEFARAARVIRALKGTPSLPRSPERVGGGHRPTEDRRRTGRR